MGVEGVHMNENAEECGWSQDGPYSLHTDEYWARYSMQNAKSCCIRYNDTFKET